MGGLFWGILLLIAMIVAGRLFATANTAQLADKVRLGGAVALGFLGLLCLARPQLFTLSLLFFAGAGILFANWRHHRHRVAKAQTLKGEAGRGQSQVRSAWLEMMLDRGTGQLSGLVIGGPFAGSLLADLSPGDIQALFTQLLANDPEGARLLEAYADQQGIDLDGPRAGTQSGGSANTGSSGPMAADEALEVLGLEPGASEEDILAAHKALLKRVHPDQGGSAYLAAKINAARDVLLKEGPA